MHDATSLSLGVDCTVTYCTLFLKRQQILPRVASRGILYADTVAQHSLYFHPQEIQSRYRILCYDPSIDRLNEHRY